MHPSPQHTPFPFACQRWRDQRHVPSTQRGDINPRLRSCANYTQRSQRLRKTTPLFRRLCSLPLPLWSLPALRTLSRRRISRCGRILNAHVTESVNQHLQLRPPRKHRVRPICSSRPHTFKCRDLVFCTLSRTLKTGRKKGIVAFSDDTPRSTFDHPIFFGRIGNIYQASNAVYLKRTTPRTIKLLRDGTVSSERAASKIRKHERGWRYAPNILVKYGATEPPSDNPAALNVWLRQWTTLLTRPLKHLGNHRYAWRLSTQLLFHHPTRILSGQAIRYILKQEDHHN